MVFKMINSTKYDGNISIKYDINDTAISNRKAFFKKLNIPFENTLIMKVKYSDDIFELTEEFLKQNQDLSQLEILTDCIITKCSNIFLYLPFGDCIPMAIFDKRQNILAFCHMGWQSTELNLHLKVIDLLKQKYNSNIEDVQVILGPSIKKESYILNNPSQLKYSEWESFLYHIGNNDYEIDLNGYICNGLNLLGINDIQNSDINTAKDENYFSHYHCTYNNREEIEGRFICGAIMLEEKN